MKRHVRELHKEFPTAVISTTGGSHLRLKLPNGKTVFAPSCWRTMRNTRRDVRRALAQRDKSV